LKANVGQKRMMFAARQMSTEITNDFKQDTKLVEKEPFLQFSKEPTMKNFGALEFGTIPEPLRHIRPYSETQLSNGIKVCTEAQDGQTAHIGVYVNSGSRDETLQTTGTSYLVQKMAQRGTTGRSRNQLYEEIENMGARYTAQSDREWTKYGM